MKPITVAELIKQLQALPQDSIVFSEGCDCVDKAGGAKVYDVGEVIVFRADYVEGTHQ